MHALKPRTFDVGSRSGEGAASVMRAMDAKVEHNLGRLAALRALRTILVVDNNPAIRYVTARTLQLSGYRTLEADTGSAGIQLARDASAVVLDVHLPDIDGFEVCRQIRSNQFTSASPIIHMSAVRITATDRAAGQLAGADEYLVKPLEPAELIATLDSLLRISG